MPIVNLFYCRSTPFFHTTSASTSDRAFICAKFCGFLPEGSFCSVAIRQQQSSIAPFPCYRAQTHLPLAPPIHPPYTATPPTHRQTDRHAHTKPPPLGVIISPLLIRTIIFQVCSPPPLPAVIFHTMFLPECCAAHLHARCVKGATVHWAECIKYILLVI